LTYSCFCIEYFFNA